MAASIQKATLLPRVDATTAGPVSAHTDDGIQINNTISSGTRNTQYNAVNQCFQTNTNPDQDHFDARFRRAICSSCPQIDRTDLIDTKGGAVGGTREWVLETDEYKAWLQDDSSPLLWIWGGPGKGKTMLSILLSQELERENKTLYFFCSAQDEKRSTAVGVIRGLLWHLTSLYPELTRVLRKDFDSCPESAFSSRDTLWEAFGKLLRERDSGRLYCIIDGLDECDKSSQLWLTKKLESFNTRSVAERPKTILVSRELSGFKDAIQLRLDSDYRKQVSSSVEAFVENRLDDLFERRTLNETLRQEVKDKILKRAQGTYLYVGFAAIELSKQTTINGIIKTLEDLPTGLSQLYYRLLDNVEPSQPRLNWRILGFVSLARRPLSLQELASVTGCKPKTSALDPTDNIRDLIEEFGPLFRILEHWQLIKCRACRECFQLPSEPDVTICPVCHESRMFFYEYEFCVDSKPLTMSQLKQNPPRKVETVDLVHESVRDFLKDAILPDGTRFMPEEMHFQLAHACLDCLVSSKASESGFASYAVDFWPFHARNSGVHAKELLSHPSSFFKEESMLRTAWWCDMRGQPQEISRLTMACLLEFAPWVDDILRSYEHKSFPSFLFLMKRTFGDCTPLRTAIHGGNSQIVEMLLQHPSTPKASIETKLSGETALYAATSRGHREIVQLLVHQKADVNAKCGKGRTSLHIASRRGYTDVVELLLFHQADIHAMSDFGTALHEATDCGHADVAVVLLRHGADVDAKRREYRSKTETALHIAAKEGQEAMARLLLQHGANVNLLSESGETPLHMAARSGIEAVLKLFLGKVDVNTMTTKGTALHVAASSGRPGVVKMLLEHGANVNARMDNSDTALHKAAVSGSLAVIKVLLEHAADVNARDCLGRTALSDMMTRYADCDNSENDRNNSNIQVEAIKRILVEHGAESDADGLERIQITRLTDQGESTQIIRLTNQGERIQIARLTSQGESIQITRLTSQVEFDSRSLEVESENSSDLSSTSPVSSIAHT